MPQETPWEGHYVHTHLERQKLDMAMQLVEAAIDAIRQLPDDSALDDPIGNLDEAHRHLREARDDTY